MKEPTKICKGCSKELPLSDYSNEPRNKDGKNGKCKLCVKTEAKIRRGTPEYREKMRGRAVMTESFARYRSKRRNASDGTVTEKSLKLLKEIQKNCCAYCLTDLNKLDNSKVHLDHIYPISKGGLHSITNVVWSCAECNQRKNSAIEGWNILTERISFEQME